MLRFALALALFPAAAPAACSTGADLPGGIVLVRNEPFLRSNFQRYGPWLVEYRFDRASGDTVETRSLFEHPLILRERIEADQTHLKRAYASDLTALARLDELGRFTVPVAITRDDGEPSTGRISFEFLGRGEVDFAGCRYDTWDIRHEVRLDDGTVRYETWRYAPGLGLVVEITPEDGTRKVAYNWIGTFADVAR